MLWKNSWSFLWFQKDLTHMCVRRKATSIFISHIAMSSGLPTDSRFWGDFLRWFFSWSWSYVTKNRVSCITNVIYRISHWHTDFIHLVQFKLNLFQLVCFSLMTLILSDVPAPLQGSLWWPSSTGLGLERPPVQLLIADCISIIHVIFLISWKLVTLW